jgi:NIPSNAP
VLPAREKYSKIVGLWQTEAGQPNEICHIWAYPDLNARAEARAAALKDPAWQEFLGKNLSLLEDMSSTVMLPAPHSPLR